MSDLVIVSDDGPIRTVRRNRPDKKNALTVPMYEAMAAAIDSAAGAADLRCIVIAGVPGAFCAGNDLQDFLHAVAHAEGLSPPPMLLHCDHVVAGTDALFSTPFVHLGLVPEAASSLLAPQRLGHARAFSLLAMGRPLDAAEARACGGVNTAAAPAEGEA